MTKEEYRELAYPQQAICLLRIIKSCSAYSFISISREMDVHTLNATGDDPAEWEVEIHTRGKYITVKDSYLEDALLLADQKANEAESEADRERARKKSNAINKLTTEEQRLLGLTT